MNVKNNVIFLLLNCTIKTLIQHKIVNMHILFNYTNNCDCKLNVNLIFSNL